MGNYSVVVLDFETTGLSPQYGDRAIEIGAVLVENNEIVDRFQSLMNPGMKVSSFIEEYTGITNRMLDSSPSITEVMHEFTRFMAQHHLVAHNAGFDSRFLDAELQRINQQRCQEFACSLLISRRVYPELTSHSLESLVRSKNLKTDGVHHRALADAEMTAHLWVNIVNDIKAEYGFKQVPFDLLKRLSKVSKSLAPTFLRRAAENQE
ncbi:MAG: 3'-5' exonuclease [Desulfuromonadaceae bacterium]|nr:3'-5' exonuclease [Desulfuromonadaceae bacterium]MDD2847101.1 3'-5' exonuclease [Desulfuromonadaceae bacterium]MDD4128921.1 3'-5' exonuclease [Desulfuromonadaceae bacterium]